jgi:hypothetical protein
MISSSKSWRSLRETAAAFTNWGRFPMIVAIRTWNGPEIGPMMSRVLAGKLLGGAAGILVLAADVARHVAWYVSHRIDPQPRDRA